MITGTIDTTNHIMVPDSVNHVIIDNYVYNITTIVVYQFTFSHELEIYRKLNNWISSEIGLWIRNHSVSLIKYHSCFNPTTLTPQCSVVASMFDKHATYLQLKWPNYETFDSK